MWVHPLTKADPAHKKLAAIWKKIGSLEKQAKAIRAKSPKLKVADYALTRPDGSTAQLSELFGDKSQLVLIHNMGKACPYCTMWADGFNALWKHVAEKAAFVLVNNDDAAELGRVAAARHWSFPVASAKGTTLFQDLGFASDKDGWFPGVSTLVKKKNGKIERFAAQPFGPGDKFNSVFSFFELLPKG